MLLEQKVKVTWTGNNRKFYQNKGYIFTKYKDSFLCKAKDLSPCSDYYVKLKCDYCGKKYMAMYKKHLLHTQIVNKDACCDCKGKKNTDVKVAKYGKSDPTIFHNWQIAYKEKMEEKHTAIWEKIQQICTEKDYELISNHFISNTSDIQYICNKHKQFGVQTICWAHLKYGEGCRLCAIEKRANAQRFTYEYVKKIIEKDFKEDNCKLISKEYIGYNDYNLKIKCHCGEIFTTSLGWFIQGKRKCNICTGSSGEYQIYNYLKLNNINFVAQKTFDNCKDKRCLKFDFYLPFYNLVIEFDGQQHYHPVQFNGISLNKAKEIYKDGKKRDRIKDNYCKNNNIMLLRIPYWDINNIKTILDKNISKVIATNKSTEILL